MREFPADAVIDFFEQKHGPLGDARYDLASAIRVYARFNPDPEHIADFVEKLLRPYERGVLMDGAGI